MVNSLKSWGPGGRVHGRWGWIHTAWVTSVWVTSLFQRTAAQLSITPDVVTTALGDTVTLSVLHEGRLLYCAWYRGGGTDGNDLILRIFDSDLFYGPKSTGQETLLPDGSLRITDVQTDHTGNYTVKMHLYRGRRHKATAQLRVHGVTSVAGPSAEVEEETSGEEAVQVPDETAVRVATVVAGSVPEAGGNNIQTSTPMFVSILERGAPPASDAPSTSWWVTLAVASGMLLCAIVAVLGVVLFYERRLRKANGATRGGSPRAIYEPAVKYDNMEKGNRAAQSPDADHTYMALKHGDQATYGHLQRPQN